MAIYEELGLPTDYKELCEFVVKHHDDPSSIARLIDVDGAKSRLNIIAKKRKPKAEPKVRPSKEEILKAIRLKSQELGRTPTKRDMDADPNMPSSYFVRIVCNGYSNAIAEAGLVPNMNYSQRAEARRRK